MFDVTTILYEDNHLLIVNKQAGELVQVAGNEQQSLEENIKRYIKERDAKPGAVFLGVPHRLDRPVSGVVVFAKTSKALTRLNAMFQKGEMHKTYCAIVKNRPPKDEDLLVHHLVRNEQQNKTYAHIKPVPHSKESRLRYTLVGSSQNYFLLSVLLLTGRHHQIRCQLSKIGCPIKGDLKYGFARSNPNGGISLHARSVSFVHPVSLQKIEVVAPFPKNDLFDKMSIENESAFVAARRRMGIVLCALLLWGGGVLAQSRMFAWSAHFAHNQGVQLLQAEGEVMYASSAGIVFPQSNEELNKVAGLSDFGISAFGYLPQQNVLLVGYENGAIEMIPRAGVAAMQAASKNLLIQDIKEYNLATSESLLLPKRINRFVACSDGNVLAATNFGLVEIDPARGEVKNNFSIHPEGKEIAVSDLVAFRQGWVAASAMGLFYCAKENLPWYYYFDSWEQAPFGVFAHDSNFTALAVHHDTLYALSANGNLYLTDDFQRFEMVKGGVKMLCAEQQNLWIATATALENIAQPQQLIALHGEEPVSVLSSTAAGVFVADKQRGLLKLEGSSFVAQLSGGLPSNQVRHLAESNGEVAAVGNGFLALHAQNAWQTKDCPELIAPTALRINPAAPHQWFAATEAKVFAYEHLELSWQQSLQGQRITAMETTAEGHLLVAAAQTSAPRTTQLHLRKNDGAWLPLPAGNLGARSITSLTRNGSTFWGIANADRLFLYSLGATPDNAADDRLAHYPISIKNDYLTSAIAATTLAADRNGEVWVGTNRGVVAYSGADPFADTVQARKLQNVSEIEGYAAYLFEYETLSAIAIDGGNRKWLGTANAGIFLQSTDGATPLQAFHEGNSPLPSNSIVGIAVSGKTGEVYIATDKGLVSFKADATEGAEDFSAATVYPNPVRPESQYVTVTGLVDEAGAKITDVAGRVVHQTVANGGTFTWDLHHQRGGKVPTGVYFVLLISPDGTQHRVAKFLVVQ